MPAVQIRAVGAVRYVELDYPDKKNGIDEVMADDLLQAVRQVNLDPECQVVVFMSTGRSFFSSGPDLNGLLMLAELPDGIQQLDAQVSKLNQVILEIYHSPKFTIVAYHGYAYGGGFNLFLACDYRIAEVKTKCIENFLQMGLTPDLSSSYFLPRLIGEMRSTELLISGRLFTAQEAQGWGLFHEVIEKRSNMKVRVEELCEQLVVGEAQTLTRMKELIRQKSDGALEAQLELEKKYLFDSFSNPTVQERLKKVMDRSFFKGEEA